MPNLLLWGAGGHARVVLECAEAMRTFTQIGFIDDAFAQPRGQHCGCPVLGTRATLSSALQLGYERALISIGDNNIRSECFNIVLQHGLIGAVIIHPNSIVSPRASIGPGTVVMPGAIINAGAQIGRNCIINTGAIIEHDCIIGDHAHISPRAVLGGGVSVGALAHVGLGAIALPGATIGDRAVIGAGAVVLRSVSPGTTVAGVPARILSQITL